MPTSCDTSDEIYRDLVHDGGPVTNPATLLPDRTIVTGGLSKNLARYLLDEHGLAVLPGESFGDIPTAFRFRAATSLLYGDSEQRWEALASPDPTRLPWIATELQRLRDILTTVMRP